MQNHPANELNIEMPLAEGAARRFPYCCESRHEQIVKALGRRRIPPRNVWVRPGEFGIGELQHFRAQARDSRELSAGIALSRRSSRRSENLFRERSPTLRNDLILKTAGTIPGHRL